MIDVRLDRMEKMMEQLIGMVANNNSKIDEMRTDLSSVKDDVTILKGDVTTLKDDVAILKNDVNTLKSDVSRLENKVDMIYKEQQEDLKILLERTATKDDIAKIVATQQLHTDWLRKLSADSVQHELEINQLKIAR